MKTKLTITTLLTMLMLLTITAVFFFSCDNPIGLGVMLDTNGPAVIIESPAPRKAVTSEFDLVGTAWDKSGVDKLIIKAEKDTVPFHKQWRFLKGAWEVSDDSGGSWKPYPGPIWNGDRWTLPVDMGIDSKEDDGEYLFSVQAWDAGNFTDDNSYKTIMLIIDNFPPSVEVSKPYLYSRYIQWNGSQFVSRPNFNYGDEAAELNGLHQNSNDATRFNSANIGKFLTQGFNLQWQIDDANDIWSIDIRFYPYNENVDEEAGTFLNNDYIFSYKKNLPPSDPGTSGNPNSLPGPNGSVNVPALHGPVTGPVSIPERDGGGTYELKKSLTAKTTVQVVSICYDEAGHANEERILGYFIYWEAAGEPWIEYTSEMEEQKPDYYYNKIIEDIKDEVFMIYPGKDMKALAFQAHGVGSVEYSIYKCGDDGAGKLTAPNKATDGVEGMIGVEIPNHRFSQIFSWNFPPPGMTGFYIVEAYAYGYKEVNGIKEIDKTNKSALHTALFRVQDLSFPKFDPITPPASDPLYMHIYKDDEGRSKIQIEGTVTDATKIENIYMVWINPQSKDYATMSQLEYYRDKDFDGWQQAAGLPKDGKAHEEEITDTTYDGAAPNKLWNIDPGEPVGKTANQRQIYAFSVEIDLEDDLHIGLASSLDDLKSQMFLLRAENPDSKCDIITYAPQGDTVAPTIAIDTVIITKLSGAVETCKPGKFANVEQFENGDVITINGEWTENSTQYLDFDTYLKPNFEFSLNGVELTHEPGRGIAITYAPNDGLATNGTFTITITLGDRINKGHLRDTLMVNMKVHDFGGNPAENSASWLVKGDNLAFLRISSEAADDTYIAGKTIELFLEFSKPVRLNTNRGTGNDPVLLLNSTGTGAAAVAVYKANQTVENTRQYFTYTVGAGHTTNTTTGALNVTGMQNGNTGWDSNTYRYMWVYTPETGTPEYVRLTTTSNGTPLPTTAANIQSLAAGKQISIDTTAPTVSSATATVGHHQFGAEVFITLTFTENVTIDPDNLPRLNLSNGNGNTGQTSASADDISVTRNTIRFKYTVQAGDTTGANVLGVTGYTGTITDIAGNKFVAAFPNSGNLTGVYLDTLTPTYPRLRIVDGSNNQINTTVPGDSNPSRNGVSDTGAAEWTDFDNFPDDGIDLVTIYNDVVRIEVTAKGTYNADYYKLEYSTNNGKDWVQISNVVNGTLSYREPLSINGMYTVTARQTDLAGNVSQWTVPIKFNWDKGTLISRIDSSTPNGTYSNNTNPNSVNVTVYFRKPLTFSGTPTITLNVANGGTAKTATATAVSDASSLAFTYTIVNGDNTPSGTGTPTNRTPYLDVTALSLTAEDAGGVDVGALLTLPTDTNLRLGYRKDIIVTTGPLTPNTTPTQPVYTITAANDQATGNIAITFNRAISKGTGTGNITIRQSTTGYRLPAVLTEAQSSRYRSSDYFNTYYTRGTNGFIEGSGSDTSTKFVLNYAIDTPVTPSNTGTDYIAKMAYDFLDAETITLPITSQDVSASGNTLTITLAGSNALQVLGATYTVTIPQNCVQDTIGYSWPTNATGQAYNYTEPRVSKPFVRVDKKINADTLALRTGTAGNTNPYLDATFALQTRARLDCRTPNSVVRYISSGRRYDTAGAEGTAGSTTSNGTGLNQTGSRDDWMNNNDTSKQIDVGSQRDPQNPPNGVTVNDYNSFTNSVTATHIEVGDNVEHGYVWRISAKGRTGTNNNYVHSVISEEIAFRTVLTIQITNMTGDEGIRPGSGDNLWIRGGDGVSSSSVPGFPLTWDDDWVSLEKEKKRAGIRLLRLVSIPNNATNLYTNSVWRWVSWEVNVKTYYDIFLGRDLTTATTPNVAANWQYGPRLRAPQRGGWSILKDYYALFPGKHRWIRIYGGAFEPGGNFNFSSSFNARPNPTVTITQ